MSSDSSCTEAPPTTLPSAPSGALHWQPGFAALGPAFATRTDPTPLPHPHWVATSDAVAPLIGLDAGWQHDDDWLQAFAGNALPTGSHPVATVYSGHQFGVWAGQLGDGRALLLGETTSGQEVQLKGAGLTPYSRMGDGRAVLRSSIREFLCSEAMHALGVPTTRALCVIGSPQPVYRERPETAAVVTRVAPSFVRFGHFEHFAARGMLQALRTLSDYVIDRYYPACRHDRRYGGNAHAALLHAVSERTADMVAHWQAIGFNHGVMNTDNMSILGLTIDYGPFQFLDAYDPSHIANHSDTQGRYAFNRQPAVAHWNLHALAHAMLPLIEDEHHAAAARDAFTQRYAQAYFGHLRRKLGLHEATEGDTGLINALLQLLARDRVDWTIFWHRLSQAQADGNPTPVRELFLSRDDWDQWMLSFSEHQMASKHIIDANLMLKTNPRYVLRNYLAELAIQAAQRGDFSIVQRLQQVLARPFDAHPEQAEWAGFAPDWASSLTLSCSS